MTFRPIVLLFSLLTCCRDNRSQVDDNKSPSVLVKEFLSGDLSIRPIINRDSLSTFDNTLLSLTERYIEDSLRQSPLEFYYSLAYDTHDNLITRDVTIYDTGSIFYDSLSGFVIPLNEYHLNFTQDGRLLLVGRSAKPSDFFEFGQLPVEKLDAVTSDKFAQLVMDTVKQMYRDTRNLYAIRLSVTPNDTLEGVEPGEYYKVTSKDYYRAYHPNGDTFPIIYFRLDLMKGRISSIKIQ